MLPHEQVQMSPQWMATEFLSSQIFVNDNSILWVNMLKLHEPPCKSINQLKITNYQESVQLSSPATAKSDPFLLKLLILEKQEKLMAFSHQ